MAGNSIRSQTANVWFCLLLMARPGQAREASLLEWLLVFAPFPSLCSHLIRISGSSGLAEFPSPSFVSDKRR